MSLRSYYVLDTISSVLHIRNSFNPQNNHIRRLKVLIFHFTGERNRIKEKLSNIFPKFHEARI